MSMRPGLGSKFQKTWVGAVVVFHSWVKVPETGLGLSCGNSEYWGQGKAGFDLLFIGARSQT